MSEKIDLLCAIYKGGGKTIYFLNWAKKTECVAKKTESNQSADQKKVSFGRSLRNSSGHGPAQTYMGRSYREVLGQLDFSIGRPYLNRDGALYKFSEIGEREGKRAGNAMKRIPRIKFPQRHPKPSGSAPQQAKTVVGDSPPAFFSRATSDSTLGGKASDQPKRTPMSNDEIEAILLGGCI